MEQLTNLGHLTAHQADEANHLGVTHTAYIQVVLDRISSSNTKRVRESKNKVSVECSSPIIIVGHGPDWEKEAIKLKGTKIPIIATDICSSPLMDMGIIPTYIVTYEEAYKRINEKLFDFKKIDEHSIQVIGSKITRQWLDDSLEKIGMDLYRYDWYDVHQISNVGIFSTMFARDMLKSDKIILIGMNCWDSTHWDSNPYLNWYIDWRQYMLNNTNTLVNCTQAGIVYGSGVIECDFNNLEIKWED